MRQKRNVVITPRLKEHGEWALLVQEDAAGLFLDMNGVLLEPNDPRASRAAQIVDLIGRATAILLTAEGL